MKCLIIILMLYSSCILAQNKNLPNNLEEKELYDFMQIVVRQLGLNKSFGILIIADTSYMNYELNYTFLSNYLIDSVAIKKHLADDSMQKQLYPDSNLLIRPYLHESQKCLSEKDILSFLQNKNNLPYYKWQNALLGFNLKNNKEWYSFTVPIFNLKKTMVIVSVSYTCNQFLCGNGDIILFKKVNNKWTNKTLSHWDN